MNEKINTNRLIDAKNKWNNIYEGLPAELPAHNGISIPKENFSEWWDIIISSMDAAEGIGLDPGLKSIYWSNMETHIGGLISHMTTAESQGSNWMQANSSQLHSYLWQIRSALSWFTPLSIEKLTAADAKKFADLQSIASSMRQTRAEILTDQKSIQSILVEAEEKQVELEKLIAKIEGHERTASTAQTNAAASATAAETEKSKAEQAFIRLDGGATQQQTLFDFFEEKRQFVESTLQGASKVALAKAFKDRRVTLDSTKIFWGLAFIFGIIILLGGSVLIWKGMVSALNVIDENGKKVATDPQIFLLHLSRYLVLTPAIWLTWFSARQYGHALKLAEDYAFKEAAAHSFIGYRSEMGDDGDMLKLLREHAVKNFGANPVRILDKNEPATPFNEAINNAIDKISPDKLIDLLRDAVSKQSK